MPKVYVVNKGGHDFSSAKRYGEIHFLSEGIRDILAVSSMYRDFAIALRESTDKDYILLTGPNVMCCIACSCFAFLHGVVNVLIYKGGRYKERKVMLNNLLGRGDGTTEEQIESMIEDKEKNKEE